MAFDASGVFYVAETNRHRVDRIDANGNLTAYAGDGSQGFSGDLGQASASQLDSPQGLVIDGSGNLYLADTHNHRIRKVDAKSGVITTVAGTGTPGFAGDGSAAIASELNLPAALALDSTGNLYIADSNNHRVRKLNLSTGILSTVAGNGIQADTGDGGPAITASIDSPTGLSTDGSGNLYLSDAHNHRVRRVSASGVITTVAGGGTSLVGASAAGTKLLLPRGLSADAAGNLYVADTQANRVLRISSDGTVSQVAGEGTQGYAGDNGPASTALMDSPRAVAVSPTGLLTLADTANQRVRQVDGRAVISTLGGSGSAVTSGLSLVSPRNVQYGTGTVTATLAFGDAAAGTITFLDTSSDLAFMLGSVPLERNTASISVSKLAAGTHTLLARYSGDAGHAAQQSSLALLTVTPASVSSVPNSVTIAYGQAIPSLTGSISGILPQDAMLVSASFSTAAQALSPAAVYPIATTLSGSSAGNYQITSLSPATLTISQAATTTALTASTSPADAVTLSARTLSTTQRVPSGRITFFDAGSAFGSVNLDASGAATLAAALAPGSHSVTAVYAGDGNFLSSSSAAVTSVVSTSPSMTQDFTLAASGSTTQTAAAGSSAAYRFMISVLNGPLNSPIVLAASGMPSGATASFSPMLIPPGGASASFTLTVQTTKTTAGTEKPQQPLWALMLWGSFIAPLVVGRRERKNWLASGLVIVLLGSLTACGTTVSSNSKVSSSSSVYPMTVTATSTASNGATLQHSAAVTLTLQ